MPVLRDIYDHVSDGREIRDVIRQTEALKLTPMPSVEASPMWQVGKELYKTPTDMNTESTYTLGIYMGIMMAQIDLLREK
jgi:hypothetical protein